METNGQKDGWMDGGDCITCHVNAVGNKPNRQKYVFVLFSAIVLYHMQTHIN